MTVSVLLFASYADALGRSSLELPLDSGATVADVVAAVTPLVEPQRTAKGIGLDVLVPEEDGRVSRPVLADPDKLQQVLLNLLSNAVKFTPEGGRVTVELADHTDARGRAVLRVRDTGIGVPT